MGKGYKDPSFQGQAFEQVKKKVMRTEKPIQNDSQGIAGLPKIPSVRPNTMRNLTPWRGFNPGKY
jgi:hypothetical protein